MVISADAKPSIQARKRIHPSMAPAAGRVQRVEHEYERMGSVCYLDAWDVRRGRRDRPQRAHGRHRVIRPARLASHDQGALRVGQRVFWIVDNGSDHRGQASIKRLQGRWRNLVLVHLPFTRAG